jgi:hypothetical protein
LSPEEATDQFIDRLRAVAACITNRPVLGTGFRSSNTPYYAGIAPLDEPVSVQTARGSRRVALHARIEYVVAAVGSSPAEYAVHTTSYVYRITDRDDREIIAWHWHPVGQSQITPRTCTSPARSNRSHLTEGWNRCRWPTCTSPPVTSN